jgi:hypothetical protein
LGEGGGVCLYARMGGGEEGEIKEGRVNGQDMY